MVARVVLIGGTSHAGKSTAAGTVARRLGWTHVSTDSLARHPGRPWRPEAEVPRHVAEHYLSLTTEELLASVLEHYRGLWPAIEALVREHDRPAAEGLVLEGSALWPDPVMGLASTTVSAVWLTAPAQAFEERIRRESRYVDADLRGRAMIDKFIARTRAFDALLRARLDAFGLPALELAQEIGDDDLCDRCLAAMKPLR